MPDKKKTTLWDIDAERVLRLQGLALHLVGKRSISALVRHIADNGVIEKHQSGQGIKDRLVVEAPKEEGEPDA